MEGHPCLLSSGAPDNYCNLSDARFPSKSGTVDRCSFGPVGAPDTVRCPLPTVGATTCRAKIARPTVGADDRWLTGQSGAPPDSPVIFSRTPPPIPESSTFIGDQPGAPDTDRCTTGQSDAPDQNCCLAAQSQVFFYLFLFFSALFLTLRQIH
jgi:hypothetical protein